MKFVYILYQILYIIQKKEEKKKKRNHKSTLANISLKMFTKKRTKQIIRTQINIPFFQFLIYVHIFV